MDLHMQNRTKYLALALGITVSFFLVELVGGILTSSLTLFADAWHMLNDTLALALALVAIWVAKRPLNKSKTFP